MKEVLPYGYRWVDGEICIAGNEAEQVRTLFREYIGGESIKGAAEKAGIRKSEDYCRTMLLNPVYSGKNGFPPVADSTVVEQAEAEYRRRYRPNAAANKGRTARKPAAILTEFEMGIPKGTESAGQLYKLIKEKKHGGKGNQKEAGRGRNG